MDQEKIGKFILNLRKKNNLTQSEFANKLTVTSQAVSKWENGRGIPDIEMLKKISEEFNVDISDILNGQEKTKVKNKKWIIVVLLIILFTGLTIFLIIGRNTDFKFSQINSKNSEFSIKGVIAYNKDKKSIYISNINYIGERDTSEKYQLVECTLYERVDDSNRKIADCGEVKNFGDEDIRTLDELLKNIEFNIDNYESACRDITHDIFLVINLLDYDSRTITYNIPIELGEGCKVN